MISKNSNIKKINDFFAILLLTLLFFVPLILFGNNFEENYQSNHFTLRIYLENFFSPFIFYYDLIGPGTSLPLDTGLIYFFLPALFIGNLKLFYLASIITCLYLQVNYLKKIFKLLKINYLYTLIFFFSLNITSVYTVLIFDQIKGFFSYSSIPVIFYYCLKFNLLKKKIDFYKIIFVLAFLFLNTHPTNFNVLIYALIFFFILNKSFFIFKKKYFYFGVILFFLIISEELYRIFIQLVEFNQINRETVYNLNARHFFSGFVFLAKFIGSVFNLDIPYMSEFKPYDNFFLPFAGVIFYFAFYNSIKLLIQKKSYQIFYINIIFLIFCFLTIFDPKIISFGVISTSILFADIINFCTVIIFGNFLNNFESNSRISKIIVSFSLLIIGIYYFQNFEYKFRNQPQQINTINKNKNFKKSEFFYAFKDFQNKNYGKLYLSPKIWKSFDNAKEYDFFLNGNVVNPVDFINYHLYPFNSYFKLSSKNYLRIPKDKFYSEIDSRIEDFNNDLFLTLFNIKFFFITDSEVKNINIKKFNTIFKTQSNNEIIYFLEYKDQKKLVFDERELNKFSKCKQLESIYCIIKFEENFNLTNKIIINRTKLNTYEIINNSETSLNVVLPFLFDSSWFSNKEPIQKIANSLMYLKVQPKDMVIVDYRDQIRIALKIISISTFLLLLINIFRHDN